MSFKLNQFDLNFILPLKGSEILSWIIIKNFVTGILYEKISEILFFLIAEMTGKS